MTLEEFIEAIRLGVVAGAYDVKYVVEVLGIYNALTTRDVLAGDRVAFLNHLDGKANDA